jgi:hypothetical protein
VHYFLLAAMRQREWEWFQYKDGVIALHLGIERTRRWWRTVGRVGFNAAFVVDVDALLAKHPITTYFEEIRKFDVVVAAPSVTAATPAPQ